MLRECEASTKSKDPYRTTELNHPDEASGGASGADFWDIWLPPRDSNPDNLLQRQMSYH